MKRATAMPAKPQLHGTSHVRVRVRLRLTLFLSSLALVSSPNLLRRRGGGGNRQIRIACTISRFVRPSVWLSVPRDSRKYAKSRCRSSDALFLPLFAAATWQKHHLGAAILVAQETRRGRRPYLWSLSEFGGRRISEMASPVRVTQLLLFLELKY